jgi:hypothetical protein
LVQQGDRAVADQHDCWQRMTEFLSRELGVSVDSLPTPGAWSCTGLTIGALSLRLNVLTLDQIDVIIDQQATDGKRFGEIAMAQGFLSPTQVDRLLLLQRLHWAIEQTERLFVMDRIDLPKMTELLHRFIATGAFDG